MITADLNQILNLTFNPYALLSLTGIIVDVILLYLIVSKGLQNSTNNWFSLFLLTVIVWGISEFFGRLSATPEASTFWGAVGAVGYCFLSTTYFCFVACYTGKERWINGIWRKIFIFAPGVFFMYTVWGTNLFSHHYGFVKVPWGWSTDNGPLFVYFTAWLEIYFFAAIAILTQYYFKVKDLSIKRQTLLLIIATIVPLAVGSVTDILFPIMHVDFPGTAILFTSVLGVIASYAVLRYQLFVINPATHIENIVQTMNEALMVFNLGDLIEYSNGAVERLFGYNPKELIGQNIGLLIKEQASLEIYGEKFRRALFENNFVKGFEIEFTGKDNQKIPVNLSGSILRDAGGRLAGYVVVATDMRELRKLVTSLTAERNKLSVTLSGIADGVFVVDKLGNISLFNESAEKIFGVKKENVVGKKADEVLTLADDDGKIKVEYFFPKERLSKDMVTFSRNGIKITQADGQMVYANLIAANIVEGEDVDLGAIVTLHDISREKDLEEMKLDFVSMAAHELRTPLTSIRGYLSVLQEELGKNLSEEQLSFLEKAFISSTQLAALVENLLSVSRIERGSLQIETQVTDWENLIEEAYNNFLPQAKERQVGLTYVKPKKKLPLVMVDKFRISEVVSNLISNALNYTPSGGRVEVDLEEKNGEVITHVKDTGQGIPESAIPKLFTKFFRVSGVLEQGSKGTGLGLYISKAIVDMHKGRIWVESQIGKGSIFSFSVPISKEQKLKTASLVGEGRKMFLRSKNLST